MSTARLIRFCRCLVESLLMQHSRNYSLSEICEEYRLQSDGHEKCDRHFFVFLHKYKQYSILKQTRAYTIIREMLNENLIVKRGAGKDGKEYVLTERQKAGNDESVLCCQPN